MAKVVPEYGNFTVAPQEGALAQPADFVGVKVGDDAPLVNRNVDKFRAHIDAIQEEQDDARVTEALTLLKRRQIQEQFGDEDLGMEGYTSRLGEAALKPDEDGLGLPQATDKRLRAYRGELAATLTTRQQKKFHDLSNTVLEGNYRNAAAHTAEQSRQYSVLQQNGSIRVDTEIVASNPEDRPSVVIALSSIGEAVGRKGALLGWDKDTIESETRAAKSGALMGALMHYFDMGELHNDYGEIMKAEKLVKEFGSELTGADLAKAHALIRSVGDIYLVDAVAEQQANFSVERQVGSSSSVGTLVERSARADELLGGGVYKMLASLSLAGGNTHVAGGVGGTEVKQTETDRDVKFGAYEVPVAKGDLAKNKDLIEAGALVGLVPGAKSYDDFLKLPPKEREAALRSFLDQARDRNHGRLVAAKMLEGYVEEYRDEGLALTAYMFGRDTADKARKQGVQAVLSEEDYGKFARVYAGDEPPVTDGAGNEVSPVDSRRYAASATFTYGQRTAYEALAAASRTNPRFRTDPRLQQQFITQFEAKQKLRLHHQIAKKQDTLTRVSEAIYESGGNLRAVPDSLWTQLSPREQTAFSEYARQVGGVGIRKTDQKTYAYYMADETRDEVASMSEAEAKRVAKCFSDNDEVKFLQHYYGLRMKSGAVADAQERTRLMALSAEGRLGTPYADKLSPSVVDGAIGLLFYDDRVKENYEKDKTGAKQGFRLSVMSAINEGVRTGHLTEKSNAHEVAAYLRDHAGGTVCADAFGDYGGKSLVTLQYDDLSDRGAADARSIVDTITGNVLKAKGLGFQEATAADKSQILHTLLLSPDSLPSSLFNGVVLGENTIEEMDRRLEATLRARGLPEAQVREEARRWHGMTPARKVRMYLLASLNVKASDRSRTVGVNDLYRYEDDDDGFGGYGATGD